MQHLKTPGPGAYQGEKWSIAQRLHFQYKSEYPDMCKEYKIRVDE